MSGIAQLDPQQAGRALDGCLGVDQLLQLAGDVLVAHAVLRFRAS